MGLVLIALIAVSMVSMSNISSVTASHSGSEVCDPSTGHCYEHVTTAAT